ncbi:MAG: hypothetical protein COW61_03950 [Candidatus Yonathbacteria bacterium CG17_big_fil_post_rev_8_21_14_2_50_46_19]|nr:MAG: hypothetical protein COW61_03950 [Candidatus Yonathbacteria bacterium CG17_big_fil_post_rev_8_21_14_2_50_46_19]
MYYNIAYAAPAIPVEVDDTLKKINDIILNPIIVLFFAIALIVFMAGVLKYIKNADNEKARTEGGLHIVWGIVGMFIMIAVYGILHLVAKTFGIDESIIS